MKILLRSLLLLVAVTLSAQSAPPKYSVVKTENSDAFLTHLNQLADQGYRVLIVSKYTVLRLEATPPDTYRYLRIEAPSGPARFTNWINEQGAHGYRWIPNTALLEKAPHPHNYEYGRAHHGGAGGKDLSAMVEQGFRPVQPIVFSSWGASTREVLFERDLDQPAPAAAPYPGTSVAIADAMRADNVMKHIDELARKGYRFAGPHASAKGGGIAVMMEKCAEDCSERYQYRYFDAKKADQVEKDLNALAKDGFRVLPSSLHSRPHLLERDTHARQVFAYRVVGPADAANLEQLLNSADKEGFAPLDFVWHVGWSAEGFLLMEKEITASATP